MNMLLISFLSLIISSSTTTITIPSSCNSMEQDGLYYVKPTESGPVIPVLCSNGYTMIDGSLDINLETIPQYFSTWDYARGYTRYIVSGLDDLSTFREWWTPTTDNTLFRIANQCQQCESTELYGDDSVYYTDGFLFSFGQTPDPCISDTDLSLNLNQYACNPCDVGSFDDNNHWTQCSAIQMPSTAIVEHQQEQRVASGLLYRPVVSLVRDACTCYKPNDEEVQQFEVDLDELPQVTMIQDVIDSMEYIDENIIFAEMPEELGPRKADWSAIANADECAENTYYLTSEDFMDGTLRITECGEYVLMEDIVFNFNPPTAEEMNDEDFSPNSIDIDELYWFPRTDQQNEDQYPGTYTYYGSFALGYFAGITIESDDVVINLNGFSLAMDYTFYFQQRFFSLIELGSKYFLPVQGPSYWGMDNLVYPNNIEIKGPGTLGLSSHHSIHGISVADLYIHDIEASQFDVAGIHCNGCQNVVIEDCIVGPQNDNIPVLGRYTHARSFLPRLRQLVENYGDEEIEFYNREPITVNDLADRLINQMDMIYHHFIDGIEYESDDPEWIAAQKLFLNPTGWMDGGSSYGLVINGLGAAVVGIGARPTETWDVTINNVEIFGIYNQVIEKIKFSVATGATRLILFDAIDWMAVSDQIEDKYSSQYIGDAYTDIIFAAYNFIHSWYYLNSLYVTESERQYVFEGNTEETGYPFANGIFQGSFPDRPVGGCNTDIQLHSSKGAIGLRLDGPQNFVLSNIYVHDIYNWADLGHDWCGEYDGPAVGDERVEIQYGYTGTRAHGLITDFAQGVIKDVTIENVESYHGEANGVTIYMGSDVEMENVQVSNINAGSQLTQTVVDALVKPNLVPRACSVDIRDDTVVSFVEGSFADTVSEIDINGFDDCLSDGYHLEEVDAVGINAETLWYIIIGSTSCVFGCIIAILLCMRKIVSCFTHKTGGNLDSLTEHSPLLNFKN